MKAILMAAGLGTRLRPITNDIPKCLVPINGKPLLEIWLEHLQFHGITEISINLHYKPDKVKELIEGYHGPINIQTSYEPELLGSLGTLLHHHEFLSTEECFFVIYADNLTDMNLKDMLKHHRKHNLLGTMGLFEAPYPEKCGIVQLDGQSTVIEFTEKPKKPRSNLANAGVYIFNQQLWEKIPEKIPADIGYDLLPNMIGQLSGYKITSYFLDIGTPESYQLAQRSWENRDYK